MLALYRSHGDCRKHTFATIHLTSPEIGQPSGASGLSFVSRVRMTAIAMIVGRTVRSLDEQNIYQDD
jgi:hypothetical protein